MPALAFIRIIVEKVDVSPISVVRALNFTVETDHSTGYIYWLSVLLKDLCFYCMFASSILQCLNMLYINCT